jgi:hypothetical protein
VVVASWRTGQGKAVHERSPGAWLGVPLACPLFVHFSGGLLFLERWLIGRFGRGLPCPLGPVSGMAVSAKEGIHSTKIVEGEDGIGDVHEVQCVLLDGSQKCGHEKSNTLAKTCAKSNTN